VPDPHYRLSPYCVFWLDPGGQTAQVVHGLYGSRFEISVDLLRTLTELSTGISLEAVRSQLPAGANDALAVLVDEKVLIPASATTELATPQLFRNRLNPLELAFHRGVNEGGYFPQAIEGAPPPAESSRAATAAALPLQLHADVGAPLDLATCFTRRQSVRAFANQPLPKTRLEQFLQLTARAHALREVPGLGWVSVRNYPSGGARYPLEIYPVIYNVESVPDGIYHYQPFCHCLEPLPSEAALRRQLNEMAQRRMAQPPPNTPSILFLITAVFARTCWKYRGMPYQIILMEVGALYQTMYLVAAQLDLAPCPIGAFPERATAELLGLDSRDEAQVGMFALGLPQADRAATARITAIRPLPQSVFSGGHVGPVIELTMADGTLQILPKTELELELDETGALRCRLLHGRQSATVDHGCRDDALRLMRNGAPRLD
jgi:SagB-type dehydrogenase family enzyme